LFPTIQENQFFSKRSLARATASLVRCASFRLFILLPLSLCLLGRLPSTFTTRIIPLLRLCPWSISATPWTTAPSLSLFLTPSSRVLATFRASTFSLHPPF